VDWFIVTRAIHIASTAIVAGVTLFQFFILAPAHRAVHADPAKDLLNLRLRMLLWIALAIAIVSGFSWLLLVAARIAGEVTEAFANGVVWTLLTETRFGHDWIVRLALALLLAGLLFGQSLAGQSRVISQGWAAPLLAACLLGSLAWSGHAGASPGITGTIHLASDVLHLVAVGAWIGALLPLIVVLSCALQPASRASKDVAAVAAVRFSAMGTLSVGTLAATGIVNTLNLAGSVAALVGTDYGRLLLVKISLFIALVGVAAVNRFRLLPRLPAAEAVHRLRRNAVIEIGFGAIIIVIVSVLGTMPPGGHMQSEPHIHSSAN
jgi:putative copper resistance protein D